MLFQNGSWCFDLFNYQDHNIIIQNINWQFILFIIDWIAELAS